MKKTNYYVNLACGPVYIGNDDWVNLDFISNSRYVRQTDLLGSLPFKDESVNAVYCSHFIEHIPKNDVNTFLCEVYRIMARGGVARFVTPDLEELCNEYIKQRSSDNHEKADFVILEMIDQLVRRNPGGELGALYKNIRNSNDKDNPLISYIYHRTGERLYNKSTKAEKPGIIRSITLNKIKTVLTKYYCRLIIQLLPSAFRKQNTSFTQVGEKHAWLYDFHTLSREFNAAGFKKVERMTCNTSHIESFPFYALDVNEDNLPRKGKESMFIEAIK